MALPLCITGVEYEQLHEKKRAELTEYSFVFYTGLIKGYIEILYGRNLDGIVDDYMEKSGFRLKRFLDAINLTLYKRLEQDLGWNPNKEIEIMLEEVIRVRPLENFNNQAHIYFQKNSLTIRKPFLKDPKSDISGIIALMHSMLFYRKYFLEINKCATYDKMNFDGKKRAFKIIQEFLEKFAQPNAKHTNLFFLFKSITKEILNNDQECKKKCNKFIFGAIKAIRESRSVTTYINSYKTK